jgi:hypothetical protein
MGEWAADARYTRCMSIVLNWNGEDLPEEIRERMPAELQHLPAGRYVLEPVDEVPELTDEEEVGIQAAIESVREGRVVSLEAAKARIDRILGR